MQIIVFVGPAANFEMWDYYFLKPLDNIVKIERPKNVRSSYDTRSASFINGSLSGFFKIHQPIMHFPTFINHRVYRNLICFPYYLYTFRFFKQRFVQVFILIVLKIKWFFYHFTSFVDLFHVYDLKVFCLKNSLSREILDVFEIILSHFLNEQIDYFLKFFIIADLSLMNFKD